jgi:phospholipid/cholesterol/gamma-HCH transport system substrate-binding protein
MTRLLTGSRARLAIVVTFLILAIFTWLYLFTGSGSYVPFLQPREWQAVIYLSDADNLVPAGRVEIAGVQVGKVKSVEREGNQAKAVFDVDRTAAPLHQGLHIRLGARSLVEDNYLDITDGTGPALPDMAVIPPNAIQPSVQLRDVLASLDDKTRASAGQLLRTLGPATQGEKQNVGATMDGLGDLGRQGNTALDAIAAQSEDLRSLSTNLTTVLQSLDTGQGEIGQMVGDAQRLTQATSDRQQAVAGTVAQLPGVLQSATDSADGINDLSGALAPVAANLKDASPYLQNALTQLPATTKDLRGLLPTLSTTLDRAPATLDRVPTFGDDVQGVIPPAQALTRDLNPALDFVAPYARNGVGIFLANFNSVLQYTDEKGAHYIRLHPQVNATQSPQLPVNLPKATPNLLGLYTNPIPAPDALVNPGPYKGPYPRVERAPR